MALEKAKAKGRSLSLQEVRDLEKVWAWEQEVAEVVEVAAMARLRCHYPA